MPGRSRRHLAGSSARPREREFVELVEQPGPDPSLLEVDEPWRSSPHHRVEDMRCAVRPFSVDDTPGTVAGPAQHLLDGPPPTHPEERVAGVALNHVEPARE